MVTMGLNQILTFETTTFPSPKKVIHLDSNAEFAGEQITQINLGTEILYYTQNGLLINIKLFMASLLMDTILC